MEHSNTLILQGISIDQLAEALSGPLSEMVATKVNDEIDKRRKVKILDKEYITTLEVCKLFSITRTTVYDWTKKGILTQYKANNRSRFKTDEVMKVFKRMEAKKSA